MTKGSRFSKFYNHFLNGFGNAITAPFSVCPRPTAHFN